MKLFFNQFLRHMMYHFIALLYSQETCQKNLASCQKCLGYRFVILSFFILISFLLKTIFLLRQIILPLSVGVNKR